MTPETLHFQHLTRPAKNKEKPPVVFLLHGYGSNEEDLFAFGPELPEDIFVISVRAPYELQPFGYAWYAINFEASQGKWNDIGQAIASRDKMKQFIQDACKVYNLDDRRVSLIGFSQGTILSFALSLSYPECIKNVIGLSGYIDPKMLHEDFEKKDHSSLNIYSSHGQMDMVIPPAWAQQTPVFLKSLQIPCVYEEFPVGHGVSPANLRSFLTWFSDKY